MDNLEEENPFEEVIDISKDIDTYKYTPDDNVKKLINDAKFDYDRDFNKKENKGRNEMRKCYRSN